MIPDFWLMNDLTEPFRDISASMEVMQGIASWIILGTVMASLMVLGLIVMLFLRDRRHEIGIYLALGETKRNVVLQLLIETGVISALAITISLFMGHVLANHLSQAMLRYDLIDQARVPEGLAIGGLNDFNQMGFGIQLTAEEMLAAYSVSLDGETVLIFYSLSMMMIILSTVIPTIYLIRLNPKKVLLE